MRAKTLICIGLLLAAEVGFGFLFACGDTSTARPALADTADASANGTPGPQGPPGVQGPQGIPGLVDKGHLYMVTGSSQTFGLDLVYVENEAGTGKVGVDTISPVELTCNAQDAVLSGGWVYDAIGSDVASATAGRSPGTGKHQCYPINVSSASASAGFHCDVVNELANGPGHPWVLCAKP